MHGQLLIVDGHAYAYRAFYAIRSLSSPSGRPTNAIYGFIKMLTRMRALVKPSHLIVVWDGGLSAERLRQLPAYKAQRPEMPGDLAEQLDEIVAYLAAANVASFCRDGVEADDYIAFLGNSAAALGWDAVIASADKDFLQLVDERIGLLNPNDKSESIWRTSQVQAKTGVLPAQVVDWLSLIGDTVDNIAGVPGVGPKTATGLLNEFGSVANLYQNLGTVKSERVRQALLKAESDVRRNQDLIRLRPEVGDSFEPETLVEKPADGVKLAELFRKWGFRSMLAELEAVRKTQLNLI